MRRHVIIGRFGEDDKTRVPKARDEVASTLQLVAGRRLDHGIGRALADLKALHLTPSEIGADILVVAAHVHAADTRISRSTESQDAWTREIRLVIPVSDPVRWTADDWFHMRGGDLARPLPMPHGGEALPHGMALSDQFTGPLALGSKWTFFRPAPDEAERVRVEEGALYLQGKGTSPGSGSPLLLNTGDTSYQFECRIELGKGATAGLVLFYDDRLYCGLGFDEARFVTHQYGIERARPVNPHGNAMRLRITNRRHIVAIHTSGDDGRTWQRFDRGMEVSGYHHNVRGGFLSLKPGLYAAGLAETSFRDFRYLALKD